MRQARDSQAWLPGGLSWPNDPQHQSLWAKSPVGTAGAGETLVEHTAWVLCRLAEQRRLRPRLHEAVGEPELWSRLFRAAFIHDWGKIARGFQAQVRPGGGKWGRRHEVLSLAFLPYVAQPGNDDWIWLAAAIASHHREAEQLRVQYEVSTGDPVFLSQIDEMVEDVPEESLAALWEWLTAQLGPWAEALGFPDGIPERVTSRAPEAPETLSGFRCRARRDICSALEAYYDWVRELHDRFPSDAPALGPLLLRGLLMTSDHAGSAHSRPFDRAPLPAPGSLLERYERLWQREPFPHQKECAGARGSIRLVAPTGSGKTESALLWAARQAEDSPAGAPRLFYMLPYQASMNAMHSRLASELEERSVALQHGKARHALFRRYLERDEGSEKALWASKAAGDLARLHVPPVRVTSPYQVLKAFYQMRGYEAALADLHGGLFILDEIHAYEVSRLALITSMIGHLTRYYGARFCFMSATFPSILKNWLTEEAGPLREVTADAATRTEFCRHHVRLRPGDLCDSAALEEIKRKAESGLSVLVCCNTVSRAQQVYDGLAERGLRPELLHSRFHSADRNEKETNLRERMGTRSRRGGEQAVMVATQVVEVSLDVDFDCLFTDLAPLDALLQRFGRINRGRKVALREVNVFEGPLEHERPYDRELLEGALSILRREFPGDGGVLDEGAVGGWLDEIYEGALAERWERTYRAAKAEFERAVLGTLAPFQACDELEDLFYRAFDGVEVLPECLQEEYLRRREEEPLRASELLVPIRWGQFGRLYGEGKVVERIRPEGVPVVNCAYTTEKGIELS